MTDAEITKFWADQSKYHGGEPLRVGHLLFARAIRAATLEEAAKVCDSVNNYDNPMTCGDVADAIRALALDDGKGVNHE